MKILETKSFNLIINLTARTQHNKIIIRFSGKKAIETIVKNAATESPKALPGSNVNNNNHGMPNIDNVDPVDATQKKPSEIYDASHYHKSSDEMNDSNFNKQKSITKTFQETKNIFNQRSLGEQAMSAKPTVNPEIGSDMKDPSHKISEESQNTTTEKLPSENTSINNDPSHPTSSLGPKMPYGYGAGYAALQHLYASEVHKQYFDKVPHPNDPSLPMIKHEPEIAQQSLPQKVVDTSQSNESASFSNDIENMQKSFPTNADHVKGTSNSFSTSEISVQDDNVEDFLATSGGFVKTDSDTANDPVKANQEIARVDQEYSSKKDINVQIQKGVKYHYFRNQDGEMHLMFGLPIQHMVPKEFILTEVVPKKKFFQDLPFEGKLHCINVTEECKTKLEREFSTYVGLLEIDMGKTEMLSNIQSHFVAYVKLDNVIVVYGYFTSEGGNTHLSDKQPFDNEAGEKKGQKFHALDRPVIVSSSQLQNIEQPTLAPEQNELRRIAFENGAKYVEKPEIKEILRKIVIEKTVDILKTNGAEVYDGIGITRKNIDAIISMEEARFQKEAVNLFKSKYAWSVMNSNAEQWMATQKEKKPLLYPYLVEMANQYNKDYRDPKRYTENDE